MWILILLGILGFSIHSRIVYGDAQVKELVKPSVDALDLWIDRVAVIEEGPKKEPWILDSNKRYSYGCMRFQADTWVRYANKLNFKGDPMNCDDAKQLARLIILNDYDDWKNWYNTTKKVGKPPVICSLDCKPI